MFTLNGISVSLGIVAMLSFTAMRVIKYRIFPLKYLFYAAPFAIISGFLCSRLSYVLLNDTLYMSFGEKWIFTDGGYMLYGAFAGGAVALCLWCVFMKKKRLFVAIMDMLAPGAAIAIAIGRCGSAFYEECYGLYIENVRFQSLPFSVYVSSLDSWCMAVFVYEAVMCLFIALAVLVAERIYAKRGAAIFHFITLYAGGRAFLESLRMDSVYYGFVRISQVVSLIILIVLFATFSVKSAKKCFRKPHIGIYVMFTAAAVTGFLCEFYMGSASYLQNYIGLGISCAVLTFTTVTVYGMDHVYSRQSEETIQIKKGN